MSAPPAWRPDSRALGSACASGLSADEHGVCRPLCRQCWQQQVPCTLLLAYSADADNVGDAKNLASAALHAFQAGPAPEWDRWRVPLSWKSLMSGSLQEP